MDHKALIPFSANDAVGTVLIFVSLVIASTGGIGGGGILAPILLLLFKFQSEYATALTNITIFGSACSNLSCNFSLRHPEASFRYLIDWETAAMLEPATMLGAVIGASLSHVLPNWLLRPFLITMLSIMAVRYLYLGITEFLEERKMQTREPALPDYFQEDTKEGSSDHAESENSFADSEIAETEPEIQSSRNSVSSESPLFRVRQPQYGSINTSMDTKYGTEERRTLHPRNSHPLSVKTEHSGSRGVNESWDQNQYSRLHGLDSLEFEASAVEDTYRANAILWLLTLFVGNTLLNYLAICIFPDHYALFAASICAWTLLVFLCVRRDVIRVRTRRLRAEASTLCSRRTRSSGADIASQAAAWMPSSLTAGTRQSTRVRPGGSGRAWALLSEHSSSSSSYSAVADIDWSQSHTLLYPCISLFAGVVAGLFGIGGGVIKSPLLLELGIHPQAAAATSSTMILFTSITALMTYIMLGRVIWDYGSFLFLLGVLSTAMGQCIALLLIRSYGHISVVTLSVGVVIAVSVVLLITE